MFDFFQPRKNAIPESSESSEAIANNNQAKAAVEPDSKASQKTPNPQSGHEASAVEANPLKAPNPDNKINQEALMALNVEVVCDLADLLPDKAKYEVTRGQAIGMALSIENGACRYFAVEKVVGLCRKRGDMHIVKELLGQVTDKALREHILIVCPELRHPGLVTPRHA
jgi:hypothetical protein